MSLWKKVVIDVVVGVFAIFVGILISYAYCFNWGQGPMRIGDVVCISNAILFTIILSLGLVIFVDLGLLRR